MFIPCIVSDVASRGERQSCPSAADQTVDVKEALSSPLKRRLKDASGTHSISLAPSRIGDRPRAFEAVAAPAGSFGAARNVKPQAQRGKLLAVRTNRSPRPGQVVENEQVCAALAGIRTLRCSTAQNAGQRLGLSHSTSHQHNHGPVSPPERIRFPHFWHIEPSPLLLHARDGTIWRQPSSNGTTCQWDTNPPRWPACPTAR